jgi:tetratricopeptide (TPR) repeat protein
VWSLIDALAWTSYPLLTTPSAACIEEGRRDATEAVELAARFGHLSGIALSARAIAVSTAVSGDVEALMAAGHADFDAMTAIQSPWVSQSHAIIATALILGGDLDEALEHAQRAIDLEPFSAFSGVGWSRALLVHAWKGDEAECRRMLDEQRASFPAPGERAPVGRLWMALTAVEACALLGWRDELSALHPMVSAWFEGGSMNGFDLAVPQRLAGMTAAARAEWDAAEELFELALERATQVSAHLEGPRVEHWYAEALVDRGRADDLLRARALLESAVRRYDAMGMPLYRERAARALAGL